jgi:ferredoxin-type protein NapF
MSSGAEEGVDPGRRAFLRGEFLSREREAGSAVIEPLGPPPPALTPALAQCKPCRGCAAPCVAACETDIIRLHPEAHPQAGTAYLSFESGGCTFCHQCIDVCPLETGARPTPPRIGLAAIDRGDCVAWDGVVCLTCRSACPYSAIDLSGGTRPRIDGEACNGCGFCVGVCPTRAIRVRGHSVD